ncbi:streptococcal hemagglutinin protein (plasmid) [Geminocystis sp. NIES-3708]|uniref:hypothetical protein n=1 Tax=Geminocystis sp. NIES-3708 TaxID=1615909 RepID=UPI0005FC94E7|nr:hypothetical protein [Geminocystis sp. NIES-3708]BAQ63111.1 streptococcal hemagglutinin protein [Geminocystis sp. NIES-3708]
MARKKNLSNLIGEAVLVTESNSNKLPESESNKLPESESNKLPESESNKLPESESNKVKKSRNQGAINSPSDEMMKETSFQGLENQSVMTIDQTATDKDNLMNTESQTTKVTDFITNQGINSRKKRGGKTTAESGKKAANSSPIEYRVTKETELQIQEVENIPKYLTLVRKEARLTEGQLDDLTLLVRKLNRTRRGKGERITENTLIRLAVDLLLQRAEFLTGATEEDLRHSLGLDSF